MIKLEVIGCGDAFATNNMAHTCFHIDYNGLHILLDCGASSSYALKRSNLKIEEIDIIFISHLHGDHIAGLPFILMELAFSSHKRKRPIRIIGPDLISDRIFKMQEILYPGSSEKIKPLIEVLSHNHLKDLDGLKFKYLPVKHSELSDPYGIRIEFPDKVLSYSGDTEWCDALIDLSSEADVFICECFSFSEQIPGHLSYKKLMSNINLLKFKSIYLTHIGQDLHNNRNQVSLDILKDGQIINIE
jgi:ribonuclease BN (tRNA processing enzyme)